MPRPRSKQPELFGSPAETPAADRVTAYIDGGARGNPGPAGYGIVITDSSGATIAELKCFLGHRTNNYAEYSALIAALEWALAHGKRDLRVASDSELLVRQMKGIYKVKSPDLRPLYEQARTLARKLERFEIGHVRREMNRRADKLANQAMDAGS
jgi:probable phosphoglycerate mutase